jgi:DNA-cytosine methyltransferase
MNVLSLFDGMSCGQQALERNGIKVDNYFASEIDKYAITVTMANYPNTKQLGSVVDVDGYSLPKIDLLIGGSPCQSFSFAGKRKGMATKDEQEILTLDHYLQLKSEGFEFEGQSYLFWEYMRLMYECKPKYFLLENVMMGEKWEKILSRAIGVNPIMINSSLLSAQNRQRLYWTNIGLEPAGLFGYPQSTIEQPKDKGILLKDVLESEVDEKYYLSENFCNLNLIDTNTNIKAIMLGRSEAWGAPEKSDGKSYTLCKEQCHGIKNKSNIRRLTPIECERLQTVKDNYTNHVSDSQRYKMLGNGWTVDVIRHILNYMKI